MKKITLIIASLFSFAIVFTACKETKKHEEKSEMHESHEHDNDAVAGNAVFQCPMDCEKGKTYGDKGSCPVCEMALKSKEGKHEGDNDAHEENEHEEASEHDEDSEDHEEAEGHDKDTEKHE